MRIPLQNIWRAFPELDAFSDEQCERFVESATRDFRGSATRTAAITIALSALGVVLTGMTARFLWQISRDWLHTRLTAARFRDIGDAYLIVVCVLIAISLCLAVLITRDQWLIRTITRKVRQAGCHKCGYSLLGLEACMGVVRCPECGAGFNLRDAGLTAADLKMT